MLGLLEKTSDASPEELTDTLAALTKEAELRSDGSHLPARKVRKDIAHTAELLIMTADQKILTPDFLNLLEKALDTSGRKRKLVQHVLEVVELLPPDDFHRRVIETSVEHAITTEQAILYLMNEGEERAPQALKDETVTFETGHVGSEYDFVFDPTVYNPMAEEKQPIPRFSLYSDESS